MGSYSNYSDIILDLVRKANDYRGKTLNLQASENVLSKNVRNALSSDFASRYSHMEPSGHNSYGGTGYAGEILEIATKLACELYGSRYAEVRPVGGHIAALSAILATCKKGDKIASVNILDGGYPGYDQPFIPDMLSLKRTDIPYSAKDQEIIHEDLENLLKEGSIKALILGQSAFVRPYDLKFVRDTVDDVSPETAIIYDGSHVMGLIAGKQFQPDALKYSDLVLGSTHKSFFGPQGGIVLTNSEELHTRISEQLIWKTMDNYHPNRLAALALALAEMGESGEKYARLVASNSRSLAKALDEGGIGAMHGPWYSYSHQILLDREKLSAEGYTTISFSEKMEQNGIILDRDGRIGTSEISHMGMTDMNSIAELVIGASDGKDVKGKVEAMVHNAPGV